MKTNIRQVWMNGKIVDETEAKISVFDSALMFGDMVLRWLVHLIKSSLN